MFVATLSFSGVVDNFIGILRPFVTVLIGLALVVFLWGVIQFIIASGDTQKVEEGKKTMLWGIIALFVMVSIQGIVYLLANSLDIRDTTLEDKYKTYIVP
ncbi:MAG TPA: hypothetical protein VJI73_01325 [Candidatus Paceibacterota bacterium]